MFKCLDSTYQLLEIDEYCLMQTKNPKIPPGLCPFCMRELFVKAPNSQEKTHFCHKTNESCSTKSYSELFNSKGTNKTPVEITALKESIIIFSFMIFQQIKINYVPNLNIATFLKILKKLAIHKNLSLKNLTLNHIPYIWLNELGEFEDTLYLYTNSCKLNLSNLPLWNTSSKKDIIIIVKVFPNQPIIRTVKKIDLAFSNEKFNFPLEFLSKITPQIFEIFKIHSDSIEIIIQKILNKI